MANDEIPNPNTELQDDTFQTAKQQQGDRAWPVPGDEGYVHPDGTPQSVQQLESNRLAAANRAAAGSIIHGAPMATPGPQMQSEMAAAVRRAEADSTVTPQEARKGHAEFVREGFDRATEKAEESGQPATPSAADTSSSRETPPQDPKPDATKRTAAGPGGKTTR